MPPHLSSIHNCVHRHAQVPKVYSETSHYALYFLSTCRLHSHTHKRTHTHLSLAPRQGKQSVALLTPAALSHHVLRPHIWRTICVTPPNVTGSPSLSLEEAERERGTQKVILGVNVLWISLDASGQSRHTAEQGRVIISRKRTVGRRMETKQLYHTDTSRQR